MHEHDPNNMELQFHGPFLISSEQKPHGDLFLLFKTNSSNSRNKAPCTLPFCLVFWNSPSNKCQSQDLGKKSLSTPWARWSEKDANGDGGTRTPLPWLQVNVIVYGLELDVHSLLHS